MFGNPLFGAIGEDFLEVLLMSKININGSILDQVIGTKLNKFLAPQQNQGGLLNFVKSPYAGDIGIGLLAQSGYSPMPTSLGQSLGVAMNQANQLRSQRRANDLAELGTLVNLRVHYRILKEKLFKEQMVFNIMLIQAKKFY